MKIVAQVLLSITSGISIGRAITIIVGGVSAESLQHAVAPAFLIVGLTLLACSFIVGASR